MKKLALLALVAAGAYAAYLHFDRRALALQRARLAPPTDDNLARSVQRQLGQIFPDAADLHVAAHRGVVTLRGTVDAAHRDQALRAALAVPGVKSVLNRLEADGPVRRDEDLPDLRIN